ncbi:hypothetical protein AJ79_06442 [Helicocarpus griseus UAMH5409]|uniref:Uncharacterized protein n=1 Tax=Helicocarpus griseus UAMH5409 TaxID=1447875 RepID=A0A2B7XD21_9EURO|nr:hypothetical protein AJ79_06442 [Helicocarpus griseus UAMH5409]
MGEDENECFRDGKTRWEWEIELARGGISGDKQPIPMPWKPTGCISNVAHYFMQILSDKLLGVTAFSEYAALKMAPRAAAPPQYPDCDDAYFGDFVSNSDEETNLEEVVQPWHKYAFIILSVLEKCSVADI